MTDSVDPALKVTNESCLLRGHETAVESDKCNSELSLPTPARELRRRNAFKIQIERRRVDSVFNPFASETRKLDRYVTASCGAYMSRRTIILYNIQIRTFKK